MIPEVAILAYVTEIGGDAIDLIRVGIPSIVMVIKDGRVVYHTS